jgi:hypothetical protein
MDVVHSACGCKWALSTLYAPDQLWLYATDFPWACDRQGKVRLLQTTRVCVACPRWEPRQVEQPRCEASGETDEQSGW